uniref:NAD-dependent deacetylase sirtuin-3, mitochondrial n=1 Tax=Magallana gigas TaxID=29159 RepID=K1R053_MAGGI
MTAVSKAKPLPLGSGSGLKGQRSHLRNFQSQSSPVYKLQSESANGTRGVRNNRVKERRGIFTVGGNNDKTKVKSLEDVAAAIKNEVFQNIVVVAGAGISTPSGIPDFRTPGTGLYDNLQQYRIPYPEAIFDIDFFHHNPKPFFTLAKELYPTGKYRPNFIHYFVRHLHDKGMLLRMYTQNIDGLERIAGLPADKMVEAHGTFSDATCLICRQRHDKEDIKDAIFSDKIPKCKKPGCMGVVKPDITFFGEDLPKRFYFYMRDMLQSDLVIVMGTSLEVQPFAGIIDSVKWGVPRVLFNMHAVGPFKYQRRAQDFISPGDLINSVQKFTDLVGWKEDMKELITKEEGRFVLCSPDYAKKMKEMQSKPPPPPPREPPVRFWRQPAKLNLFDSESESSSEMSETESESSEEDQTPRPGNKNNNYRRGVGVSKSAPRGGSKNDLDMKRNTKPGVNGKRNYSTDSQLTTRSERPVRNNRNHATAVKITQGEVNQVASRLDRVSIRPKSNTPDSGKGKLFNEKPIRRTVSDKNLKSKVPGVNRPLLQRSNSAKSVNEKEAKSRKEQKESSIGKSVSETKSENKVKAADSLVLKKGNEELFQENNTVLNGVNNCSESSQTMTENARNKISNERSHTRPPLPQNQRNRKPPLNPINPRPYGFEAQRKLPHRPSIQANLVREKFFTKEDGRPASAEMPRIAYRHRLKPSYDARIFATRVVDTSSESSEESSSDESR